jgi:uncharacterized membrane protein YkoI
MMHMNGLKRVSVLTMALVMALAVALPAAAKYKPKVTMAQAREMALQAVPGATIKSEELEKEKGQWVYSFDMQSGKEIREVWIDPETGKVLANEVESPAKERAESKAEAKS